MTRTKLNQWCKVRKILYKDLAKTLGLTLVDIQFIAQRRLNHIGKIYLVSSYTNIPMADLVPIKHIPYFKKAQRLLDDRPMRSTILNSRKMVIDGIDYKKGSLFEVIKIDDSFCLIESMAKKRHWLTTLNINKNFRMVKSREIPQRLLKSGSEIL